MVPDSLTAEHDLFDDDVDDATGDTSLYSCLRLAAACKKGFWPKSSEARFGLGLLSCALKNALKRAYMSSRFFLNANPSLLLSVRLPQGTFSSSRLPYLA